MSASGTEAKLSEIRLGGIEAGGTSFAISLAIGNPTNVVKQVSLITTSPEETLQKACDQLKEWNVAAVGIACFGPIDLDPKSPKYGYITSTPKVPWRDTDVVGTVKSLMKQKESDPDIPVGFTTDVNAAALAELHYGDHGNVDTIAYTTVGTGIGVGVVVKGQELTGLLHPEGGHFYPRRHRLDTYAGNCPYHADCLEGLANAQACAERCSVPPHCLADVNDDHATWDLAAYYLAQLCVNATLLLSPQVIVLGGGVLKRKVLFPKIRAKTLELLNGYVQADKIINHIDKYIVPSKFNAEGSKTTSGAVGALHLAQRAFIEASKE